MLRFVLIVALLCLGRQALAAGPAETLFPATTKGFLTTSSVAELQKNFKLTPLGKLTSEEKFQPLLTDLQKQLDDKLEARIGLKLDDVIQVTDGELAFGLIQPKDRTSHAVALVADVKGKIASAEALLADATKTLLAKKATKTTKKAGDATLTLFELAKSAPDKPAEFAVYCLHADTLVAADHEAVAAGIVGRLGGGAKDSLASVAAFTKVADKTNPGKGKGLSHLQWFIEPLGYAETSRAAQGGKKRRGVDLIKVLRGQGFESVQGVGGCVQLHTDNREILHRTYAYAPAASDAKKGERYRASANLLDFPNTPNLSVQPWVPNEVSSYLTLNTVPTKVFKHVGTLYDAYLDEPGIWKETIDAIKGGEDKAPPLDLSKEFIAHLAGRVTLITHYREPITPQSERRVLALELKPGKAAEAAVRGAIDKLVARRDARKIKVGADDGWELLESLSDEEKEKKRVPKSEGVVVVQQEHLFFGSHVDYLQTTLLPHKPADQLANAADLKLVRDDLEKLGSDLDSFRFFSRNEQAWRVNYELIGKDDMPGAETLLAKLLDRLLSSGKKGVPRIQVITPKLLPPFAEARPFLVPAGSFTRTDEEGWLMVGSLKAKE